MIDVVIKQELKRILRPERGFLMKYTGVKLTSKNLKTTREFYETLFDLKTVDIDKEHLIFANDITFVKTEKWKDDIDKKSVTSGNSSALCFYAKDLAKLKEKFNDIDFEINYVDTLSFDDPEDSVVRIYDPDKHIVEISYKEVKVDNKASKAALENKYTDAVVLLGDPDAMDKFLLEAAAKVKAVPAVGNKLVYVPVFISLVYDYVNKRYTKIPAASLVAIVSALIYFLSPIDLIPDATPIAGYIDDGAVIAFCWSFVNSDIEEYMEWAKKNGKNFDMSLIDPEKEKKEYEKKKAAQGKKAGSKKAAPKK